VNMHDMRITRLHAITDPHIDTRRAVCSPRSFFHETATTELYTLSLHDALPISLAVGVWSLLTWTEWQVYETEPGGFQRVALQDRSEEHTSELQSRENLVCRLLLEKKKRKDRRN